MKFQSTRQQNKGKMLPIAARPAGCVVVPIIHETWMKIEADRSPQNQRVSQHPVP